MRTLLVNPAIPYSFLTMECMCELTEAKALVPPLGLLTVAEWKRTIVQLYKPENYLARAYNYILGMRPTRSYMAAQKHQPSTRAKIQKGSEPENREFRDLRGAVKLFWRQGIKAPYRGQFWRQLLGIWRHNPSRLKKIPGAVRHG